VVTPAGPVIADDPSAAARFTCAIRETEELPLAMAAIGTARDYGNPELAGMRLHLVEGFREYPIFYVHASTASRSCVCCTARVDWRRFPGPGFGAMGGRPANRRA
jgi:hypothetical protein